MKNNVLQWIPRILAILAILFVMMFSLDVFGGNEPIYMQLVGFLIHNIPAFVLMAALAIAWKREFLGGLIFIGLGTALSIFVFILNYNRNHSALISLGIILMVAFPFVVAGILFIFSHNLTKKKLQKAQTE